MPFRWLVEWRSEVHMSNEHTVRFTAAMNAFDVSTCFASVFLISMIVIPHLLIFFKCVCWTAVCMCEWAFHVWKSVKVNGERTKVRNENTTAAMHVHFHHWNTTDGNWCYFRKNELENITNLSLHLCPCLHLFFFVSRSPYAYLRWQFHSSV